MELQHHGIKGQKWGVRRYQNKDGTLTPAGKDRYNDTDSDIQQETPEERKKRIRRNVMIGAAAVTVALGVMGYMRYKKNSTKNTRQAMEIIAGKKIDPNSLSDVDKVIKRGTKMQRISSKPFESYVKDGETIYTSYLKSDNKIYMKDMPKNIEQWRSSGIIKDEGKEVYKHVLTMNKDVKVASPKKVAEAYRTATNSKDIQHHKYMNFITGLSDRDNETNKKFINILKDMGYNAIIDENDAGHYTKSPLILLNPSGDVLNSSSKKISKLASIINVILM